MNLGTRSQPWKWREHACPGDAAVLAYSPVVEINRRMQNTVGRKLPEQSLGWYLLSISRKYQSQRKKNKRSKMLSQAGGKKEKRNGILSKQKKETCYFVDD